MVDLQNLFPDIEIDNLQVYSLFSFLFIYLFIYLFILIFAGEVPYVFYFQESFVIFYHMFAHYFCFTFSAILDFQINAFFTIITCLNPIGSNKRTTSLIVSFYPLVTIILEAAIVRHFMNFCKIALSYQEQTVLDQLLLL